MEKIKIVFIISKRKDFAMNTLHEFRTEFGEYVVSYNRNSGQVALINGINIIAISEEEKMLRFTGMHNCFAVYGAEYFMEICYKNAYHAAKKEIDILKAKLEGEK